MLNKFKNNILKFGIIKYLLFNQNIKLRKIFCIYGKRFQKFNFNSKSLFKIQKYIFNIYR